MDEVTNITRDRVDTNIKVKCSRCGHTSTVFIDQESVVRELRECFNFHGSVVLLRICWRGWGVAFALGLLVAYGLGRIG